MTKILFTICGRAGSKGLKNKNLKYFLDYPLSFYSVSIIDLFSKNNPKYDCDIVLNTDSFELINLFENQLITPINIISRKPDLGLDNTPKIAVIKNCYDTMKENKGVNYDIVVDLDITSPLRVLSDLESIIEKKINSSVDVVFSVTDSRRNPYFNMVKKSENGYERVIKSNLNTRQEAPEIYDMNASIYAYSPYFLQKNINIFEGKCDVIKMKDTGVLDIDSENDFELMEIIAKWLYQKFPEMKEIQDNISKIMFY